MAPNPMRDRAQGLCRRSAMTAAAAIAGITCMVVSLFLKEDSGAQNAVHAGLFLFTGMAVSSKIYRLRKEVTKGTQLLWALCNTIFYLSFVLQIVYKDWQMQPFWLLAILVFGFTWQIALQTQSGKVTG